MRKTVLSLLAIALSVPLAAAPRRRAATPPSFPACGSVAGTPAVAFSRDGGQSFVLPEQKLEGVGYTYGLAALDATTLLSWHKSTLSISRDAGCHWSPIGDFQDGGFPPTIVAGRANDAWIYSDNREFLAHYDNATRTLTTLKAPGSIVGLTVDAAFAPHVIVGTAEAGIFESVDAGLSWNRIAVIPAAVPLIYRVAIDPHDPRHFVAGTVREGVLVSKDNGRTWITAKGLGKKDQVNAFQVLFAPSDPNVVWAMALDMSDEESASHGRHLYRSTDGGLTFTAVVDASADVPLINQPVMAAHPTDPNVVYFVFGTFFQGYGTDIFRFDAATHFLQKSHLDFDDVNAIAFSPVDPNVMYFGLEVERGVR